MNSQSESDTLGIVNPQALARTYSGYKHEDPWEAVKEYQDVIAAAAEHPGKGSAALSSIVELPRGRIRGWIDDDGMPDPARAIQVANKRGLMGRDPESREVRALAGMVAWIFSSGSIVSENYTPRFALDEQHRGQALSSLNTLTEVFDINLSINERSKGHGDEVVITEHATIVGRCLATAGAPVGEKAGRDLVVPPWIQDGNMSVQQIFTWVYLFNRGVRGGRAEVLQLRENDRPKQFHETLAKVFESVAGVGVVQASKSHIRADIEATDALDDLLKRDVADLLEG